ncbi:MAG: RpiB/LacA/LacB family sugar-phosphate isomerase [Clostridia bacterium]
MKIAIGSDHGGFELKETLIPYIMELGYEIKDLGCYEKTSCDYPDYGFAVGEAVRDGGCERGIAICSTGIGISISANKVEGIGCALCTNAFMAKAARETCNANVLALGGLVTDKNTAKEIVRTFLGE